MKLAQVVIAMLALVPQDPVEWVAQPSGTKARLRGLSVVSRDVAWASGSVGTILRTNDGGTSWVPRPVAAADTLDFRDIEAFDGNTAVALSVGPGGQSRIYGTSDGGAHWTLRHTNPDRDGFLDALVFWDRRHGLALGDPVGGHFVVLATDDGGTTWSRVAPEGMPAALPGEGAFAASGTCLVVRGDHHAWFGTGAGRVFRSDDRGHTWTAHATPITSGNGSSGIFSLAFWDNEHGVAVGGDHREPDRAGRVAAITSDGGKTWQLPSGNGPGGYRSAVVSLPGSSGRLLIAVGPKGASLSRDGGNSWAEVGHQGFHAVATADPDSGWAVGEDGTIARFSVSHALGLP